MLSILYALVGVLILLRAMNMILLQQKCIVSFMILAGFLGEIIMCNDYFLK